MGTVITLDTEKLTFLAELEEIINAHSKENGSNTPDYLLAAFMSDCLKLWDQYTVLRDHWYGVNLEPGNTFFHQDRPKVGIPAFIDARCTFVNCGHAKEGKTYRMIGRCSNCYTQPILGMFTTGHEARTGTLGKECPACGIRALYWNRMAEPDEVPIGFNG